MPGPVTVRDRLWPLKLHAVILACAGVPSLRVWDLCQHWASSPGNVALPISCKTRPPTFAPQKPLPKAIESLFHGHQKSGIPYTEQHAALNFCKDQDCPLLWRLLALLRRPGPLMSSRDCQLPPLPASPLTPSSSCMPCPIPAWRPDRRQPSCLHHPFHHRPRMRRCGLPSLPSSSEAKALC